MSTGLALDLNVDDDAWLAALDALLVDVKVNERGGTTEADARFKAIAQWANLIDDFVIACKRAQRMMYRGTGSPEGVVSAPVGSIYQRIDAAGGARFYVKDTGSGSTGWTSVGSGGDAATLEGATLAEARRTAIETEDGSVSLHVDLIQIETTEGLTLTSFSGGLEGRIGFTMTDPVHGARGGGTQHAVASGVAAGFMSAADKNKLDGVATGAGVVVTETEIDFAALGSATNLKTGGNGNKTIGGRVWELANEANATNFRYGSTYSGLEILATTTTTTFNQTTQSSPYIRIPWGNLVTSYNAAKDYVVQVRLTNWVPPAASDAFYLGIWGATNGSLTIADIATLGPTGTSNTAMAASAGISRTTAPGPIASGPCDVVLSLAITGGKCRGFVDLWNAIDNAWPTPANVVGVCNEEGTTNSSSTQRDTICCIVLALRATSVAGTCTATVRGLRVIS